MTEKPYNDGAHTVNSENRQGREPPESIGEKWKRKRDAAIAKERQREILAAMDLIRTEDVIEGLGCSKETLAKYRSAGLQQLGEGKQRYYRLSKVAVVMEMMARASGSMEADGDEA